MLCRFCGRQISDDAVFCSYCGKKQAVPERNPRRRGNGTGSVYKLPSGKYKAVVILGYYTDESGHKHKKTRSKVYDKKRDATNALAELKRSPRTVEKLSFKAAYDRWLPTHNRVVSSTLGNYKAAFKYFEDVYALPISDIEIEDLQECLDECPQGKRTKENMKAVAGLIYKYAIPRHLADINMAQYLKINASASSIGKEGLPLPALAKIERAAAGGVPGADYVLCNCYLGFRPSEFLALDIESYNASERAFVGGAKTEAGRNRTVTVSPKIQGYIDAIIGTRSSGPVFCAANGARLNLSAYRDLFYNVLDNCGIDNPIVDRGASKGHYYTPHSCRHTFATLMKRVAGTDKDKLALIGHASDEMLRYYQDVAYDDLRAITDKL